MRIRTILIASIAFAAMFAAFVVVDGCRVHGQDATSVQVEGFSPQEADNVYPIAITGPATADVGEPLEFVLTGMPPIDRSKPLDQQEEWLFGDDRMFVFVGQPGEPLKPSMVEVAYRVDTQAGKMVSVVTVDAIPESPGDLRVLVDWNYGQNCMVDHLVKIGGQPDPQPDPDPGPDPDPNPQPGPIPPGPKRVVVIEESSTRTPETARVIADLEKWCDSQSLMCAIRDQHVVGPDGRTPEWFEGPLASIAGKQLPVLMVSVPQAADEADKVLGSVALPMTLDASIEWLKPFIGEVKR